MLRQLVAVTQVQDTPVTEAVCLRQPCLQVMRVSCTISAWGVYDCEAWIRHMFWKPHRQYAFVAWAFQK